MTTLDGVERTLDGRAPWAWWRVAATARPRPRGRSWAAPRARSARRRRTVALEAAYWEPLAIRRGGPGPRHAHGGLAPLRARGRLPRARSWPSRASPTCWRRSGPARVRPALIERQARAAGAARDRLRLDARRARFSGTRVPEARGSADPRGPRLRVGPWGSRTDRSTCRAGASTSRARSISSRRSAGTTGSTGSRPRCRRRAAPGALRRRQRRERRIRDAR